MRRVSTSDAILEQIQNNTSDALDEIKALAMLNGRFVDCIVTSSDTRIAHRLGRNPLGWIVVSLDQPITVYQSPTANTLPVKQLILRSSGATANATLYVF